MKKYKFDFDDFLYMLDMVAGKYRKKKNGKFLGYPFNMNDDFNAAFIIFIILIKHRSPELFEKLWPNNEKKFSVENLKRSLSAESYSNEYGLDFLEIWRPFLTPDNLTIKESFNDWLSLEQIHLSKETVTEFKNKYFYSDEQIKKIDTQIKEKIKVFLNYIGELYANSITHGLNQDENIARASSMMSVISQEKVTDEIEKWKLMHVDMGMTIQKNLERFAPQKVIGLSYHEMCRWVLQKGNSSKSDSQRLKGGGFTVLKSALFYDGRIEILSGNYHITMVLDHERASELDNIDSWENFDMDKYVKHMVQKLDYNFPGTLTWIEMQINNKESIDIIKENFDLIEKMREVRDDKLKEFIHEN